MANKEVLNLIERLRKRWSHSQQDPFKGVKMVLDPPEVQGDPVQVPKLE